MTRGKTPILTLTLTLTTPVTKKGMERRLRVKVTQRAKTQ